MPIPNKRVAQIHNKYDKWNENKIPSKEIWTSLFKYLKNEEIPFNNVSKRWNIHYHYYALTRPPNVGFQ